jgi:hypothetical protein
MAVLNMMNPARYCSPYRHQLEQQQSSSRPSVQQQYIPARARFIQIMGPIARKPYDIANSKAYNHLNVAHSYGNQLHQQQPRLPCPRILGQIVPALRSKSWNTDYNAGYSNGTSSRMALPSNFQLPAVRPSQSTPLPPGLGPLARREQQEMHVAPSRLSN